MSETWTPKTQQSETWTAARATRDHVFDPAVFDPVVFDASSAGLWAEKTEQAETWTPA